MVIENKQLCINADVGEGYPWDEQIMPWIHTCNIACGGHIGDPVSISKTLLLAKKHNVTVGAHPSFPDKNNFGRTQINISDKALKKSIISQLRLFLEECYKNEIKIHHIKLHGALYHEAAYNMTCGKIILDTIFEVIQDKIIIFAPCQSPFVELCQKNDWPVWQEAFIDRHYEADYRLTPRSKENAIIKDPELCFNRIQSMFFKNQIIDATGVLLPIFPDTYCIHGDEPNTVEILKHIHIKFSDAAKSTLS
jgi:UPF0271 protein